jgi:hypothetical protein
VIETGKKSMMIIRVLSTIGVAVFLGIVATWATHTYLHDLWYAYLLTDGYALAQSFVWYYGIFPIITK